MESRERKLLLLALCSRLLAILFIIAADYYFDDLDSSERLQNFSCEGDALSASPMPSNTIIDGLATWDSVYFIRIAKCGYENDMIHAFFPLLPSLMRAMDRLLPLAHLLQPVESRYALYGFLISFISFGIAAVSLYRLTKAITNQESVATMATLVFCVNPATVFYTVAYTESLFSATTFLGLLLLKEDRFWTSVLCLTAASATRSNGFLAIGYVLYPQLMHLLSSKSNQRKCIPKQGGIGLVQSLMGSACIAAPYVSMQIYAYREFCLSGSYADSEVPWCFQRQTLYSFVQEKYWDVGFLRFYSKFERLANVLQSLPILLLSFSSCWQYFRADWRRALTLGGSSSCSTTAHTQQQKRRREKKRMVKEPVDSMLLLLLLRNDQLLPYMYHLAFMTCTLLLVMHINVGTRFLSTCPPIYWFASTLLLRNPRSWASYGLWVWCFSYSLIGCLLWPNFYPWT